MAGDFHTPYLVRLKNAGAEYGDEEAWVEAEMTADPETAREEAACTSVVQQR